MPQSRDSLSRVRNSDREWNQPVRISEEGRQGVFTQAASQSDAEAIASCRYGAFHSVSRAGLVPSTT
jgi:hypothetical protein